MNSMPLHPLEAALIGAHLENGHFSLNVITSDLGARSCHALSWSYGKK